MLDIKTHIDPVKGFRVAGIHGGLKADNALDMALIFSDRPCATGGVFTTNRVKAAPVLLCQQRLKDGAGNIRAVFVNTKCANAATGATGLANAQKVTEWIAEHAQVRPEQVLMLSTGVIGTQLPMNKIEPATEQVFKALGQNWDNAARGIMTTDTRPKLASVRVLTASGEYTIAGIAKGAGMIAPNMATMLGVIVTDAKMNPAQAQSLITSASQLTFNRIVIDGDTSTNDAVILMASGASGVSLDSATDMVQFQQALIAVCASLAKAVVRDGEGATKFITLDIRGAASDADAHAIGNTIAASPLVKTAFFGNDANWGRIIAAAGRAGVEFNPDRARLHMVKGETVARDDQGNEQLGLLLFEKGMPTKYKEADATATIKEQTIYVTLDCGVGNGRAIVWTCDLSHDYVDINGSYRS